MNERHKIDCAKEEDRKVLVAILAQNGYTVRKEQIEKYNSTNSPSHKAFLVEVEDGSFEQYLLDSLHRKYRLAADAIQAAKDALGEALDCIESLEVKER